MSPLWRRASKGRASRLKGEGRGTAPQETKRHPGRGGAGPSGAKGASKGDFEGGLRNRASKPEAPLPPKPSPPFEPLLPSPFNEAPPS